MTVKELIIELQAMPLDARVSIQVNHGEDMLEEADDLEVNSYFNGEWVKIEEKI